MSDERFLSALKEAKDLFLEKSQVEARLTAENGKLLHDIKELKNENEKLLSENKRLTEKSNQSKQFVKVYFKDQSSRMKEIERKGVYNAETFSYLIGDIGRSLCNATFNETHDSSATPKKTVQGRLSTNKQNRRARYENVEPSEIFKKPSNVLNKDGKQQTAISVGKWQNINNFYNAKNRDGLHGKNERTDGIGTKKFAGQEHSKNSKNQKAAPNKIDSNLEVKNFKPPEIENVLDPNVTLPTPIGPPFECSTQMESDKNRETYDDVTQFVIPSDEIWKSKKTIPSTDDSNFLDPDLTLRSPIGPPSKASTPQGPKSGEEPKKFTLAFSSPPTSPSLLGNEDSEGLRGTLLPQIPSMEGEVPEESQPRSPTILTRSHSLTRSTILVSSSPNQQTPKRKREDISFGSLLDLDGSRTKHGKVDDIKVLGETRHGGENESEKHSEPRAENVSPEIIVLDDSSYFVKPSSKKKARVSVADESALLFCSPEPTSSKTLQSDGKPDGMDPNEEVKQEKPKITLNFNLDESTDNEKNSYREEKNGPQYKYKEVVRGKDKRAKLNGYFCSDCEKYYGSLKLSEAEIQERLKACSRHRARFSPPPSTPEHFWEVDFMNTNEYIEKGYMRTASELPPEKRKLKSRKLRLGKQQKQ